jgi:hypothetical protein
VCAGFGRVGQIVGRILGLFQPTPTDVKEQRRKMHKVDETRPRDETVTIDLLHRAVPAKHTDEGLRALSGESPICPESVQKYLESKFSEALEDVSKAMLELAKSLPPAQLAEKAYTLYEKFRPEIPPGKKGRGASGKLDLDPTRWPRPNLLLFDLLQDFLDHLSVFQADGQEDSFHWPRIGHVDSGTGMHFGPVK